jgi:hypothetical protein
MIGTIAKWISEDSVERGSTLWHGVVILLSEWNTASPTPQSCNSESLERIEVETFVEPVEEESLQ